MSTLPFVMQIAIRIGNWLWLAVSLVCFCIVHVIVFPLRIAIGVIFIIGLKRRAIRILQRRGLLRFKRLFTRSPGWWLVRPFVFDMGSDTRTHLNKMIYFICEYQYLHSADLPPYVKIGPGQFRRELQAYVGLREAKGFWLGPTGWSGDSFYDIVLGDMPVQSHWTFVGLREDILARPMTWFSLFVQRHELQHEIQRCFDGAHDAQVQLRLSRELEADDAAFGYLSAIGRNRWWHSFCWSTVCKIRRFWNNRLMKTLIVLGLCVVGWFVGFYLDDPERLICSVLLFFSSILLVCLAIR